MKHGKNLSKTIIIYDEITRNSFQHLDGASQYWQVFVISVSVPKQWVEIGNTGWCSLC